MVDVSDEAVRAAVRVLRSKILVSDEWARAVVHAAVPHLVAERNAEIAALKSQVVNSVNAASLLFKSHAERDARIKVLEEALREIADTSLCDPSSVEGAALCMQETARASLEKPHDR